MFKAGDDASLVVADEPDARSIGGKGQSFKGTDAVGHGGSVAVPSVGAATSLVGLRNDGREMEPAVVVQEALNEDACSSERFGISLDVRRAQGFESVTGHGKVDVACFGRRVDGRAHPPSAVRRRLGRPSRGLLELAREQELEVACVDVARLHAGLDG